MISGRRCRASFTASSATPLLLLAAFGLMNHQSAALGLGLARAAAPAVHGPHLLVLDQSGDVLLSISLADDPIWIVRWNHSVTGIVVSDYYEFLEDTMYLSASHTPSFDAGLGHIPGRGRLESDGEHGYWIRAIDEAVAGNAYRLRVGPKRVDHRIVHAGHSYSLSDLAANQPVTIEVAP